MGKVHITGGNSYVGKYISRILRKESYELVNLTRDTMLHMMFKLGQCAEKKWRRLRGFDYLAKVIIGIKFKDGVEVTTVDQAVVARTISICSGKENLGVREVTETVWFTRREFDS